MLSPTFHRPVTKELLYSENAPLNMSIGSEPLLVSSPSISERYTECLVSFKSLFAHLSHSSNFSIRSQNFKTGKTLDQYARIRTWGEESRAALPAASRSSLDNTLRNNTTMKPIVISILEKIRRQIDYSLHEIRVHDVQEEDLDSHNPLESDSEDVESSSEEEIIGNNREISSLKKRSARIVRNVQEDIDSLYQVLLMIRRPGFKRRYIKSTIQDEFDPSILHYIDFDIRHVEDKIRNWERRDPSVENQEITARPDIMESRNLSVQNSLTQRLARANTKRREQLMHWSNHPDRAPSSDDTRISMETSKDWPVETSGNTELGADKVSPKAGKFLSNRSVMTRNTFSTMVVSDIFGTKNVAGPARTIYADSSLGDKSSNRVPNVPSVSLQQEEFECPYCGLLLNSDLMQIRSEWKRHVFRDLRPYICTFADCQTPDKQYTTRYDWIYHEMQMHRRQWYCAEHDSVFQSKGEFTNHLTTTHLPPLSQQQLSILAEISERQSNDMDIVPCPLCSDERRLKMHYTHLAEHLESLALFVIPLDHEEDSSDGEKQNADHAADGNQSSQKEEPNPSHSSIPSQKSILLEGEQNTKPMTRKERLEDERRRLTASCFSKVDADGKLRETYITHVRIEEDVFYPISPPPPSSSPSNKKNRVIIISLKNTRQVLMHKARENTNGTFSIGKTWALEDLSHIENFVGMEPKNEEEVQHKEWAAQSGFIISFIPGIPYYWKAENGEEKDDFLGSLIRIYNVYTDVYFIRRGNYPVLKGFSKEELNKLTNGQPNAATAEGRTAFEAWRESYSNSTPRQPDPVTDYERRLLGR